jgi:hypothetical protein
MTDTTDYESLTVPELKHLAEKRGIELLHDARKAEIIAALEASDQLERPEGGPAPKDEGDNEYNFNTSSTTVATITHDDFWKIKLTA